MNKENKEGTVESGRSWNFRRKETPEEQGKERSGPVDQRTKQQWI